MSSSFGVYHTISSISSLYERFSYPTDSQSLTNLSEVDKETLFDELNKDPELRESIDRTLIHSENKSGLNQLRLLGDISKLLSSRVSSRSIEVDTVQGSINPNLKCIAGKMHVLYLKAMELEGLEGEDPLEIMTKELGLSRVPETEWKKSSVLNQPRFMNSRVDEKLFAHVHGEEFIKNTEYEGNLIGKTLEFLADFMQKKNEENPHHIELQRLNCMLENAREISKSIEIDKNCSPSDLKEKIPLFLEILSKHTKHLQPGDSTLVPTGYPRHAMYLEVMREETGKLTVRMYNTGDGIFAHHASLEQEGNYEILPYVELTHVSDEKLLNETYIKAFLEVTLLNISSSGQRIILSSAEDHYRLLLTALDGQCIRTTPDRSKLIRPQVSGTCTWSGLMAVMHTRMDPLMYHQFLYEVGLETLCACYQNISKTLVNNDQARELLFRGAKLYAQRVIEAYHLGAIGVEELSVAYATINELFHKIRHADRAGEKKTVEIDFKNLETIPTIFDSMFPEPPELHDVSPSGSEELKIFPLIHVEAIDNPEQIPYIVNKFCEEANALLRNGGRESVIESLSSLFEKLVKVDRTPSIEDVAPPEEIEKSIVAYGQLSDLIFKAKGAESSLELEAYAYYLYGRSVKLISGLEEFKELFQSSDMSFQGYEVMIKGDKYLLYNVGDQNLFKSFQRTMREYALTSLNRFRTEKYFRSYSKPFFFMMDSYKDLRIREKNFHETYDESRYVIDQFRNNEEFKAKFLSKHPELSDASENRWAMEVLCDFKGEFLPPAFAALRRQALLFMLMQFHYKIKSQEMDFVHCQFVETPSPYPEFLFEIHNIEKYIPERNIFGDLTDPDLKELINSCRTKALLNYDRLYNENVITVESKEHGKNIFESGKKRNLTKEDVKDLLLLMCRGDFNEENSHLEQQVIKVISYFHENIHKLIDPQIQALFKLLLFESNFLEVVLELNPKFAAKIIAFVDQGWKHFFEIRELQAAAFFIEIGRVLENIVTHRELIIEHPFPPFRQLLLTSIERGSLTSDEKTTLYYQVAASYNSHPPEIFTKEDALNLVKAFTFINSFPKSDELSSNLKKEVAAAKMKWVPIISTYFQGENGDVLCQNVVEAVDPLVKDLTWDNKTLYPVCVSSDGALLLNIETGVYYRKDQKLSCLPAHITLHPEFPIDLYIPGSLCHCLSDNPLENVYSFTDKRGTPTMVIWSSLDHTLQIIQNIDGIGQCRLISYSSLVNIFNDPKNRCTAMRHLFQNHTIWIPLSRKETEIIIRDQTYQPTHLLHVEKSAGSVKTSPVLTLRERLKAKSQFNTIFVDGELKSALLHTLKEEPKDGKQENLISRFINTAINDDFIEEHVNKDIRKYYLNHPLELNEFYEELHEIQNTIRKSLRSRETTRITECYKFDDPRPPLQLVDIYCNKTGLPPEISRTGLLWKDSHNELKLLELPAYGLNFKIKAKGRGFKAYSKEYPGYFLSRNQHIRRFQTSPSYLILENKEGNRKLIMPYGKVSSAFPGSLSTKCVINQEDDSDQKSISYDLDEKKRLTSTTREQKIYLANIYLAQKKYPEAIQQLRSTRSPHFPYDTKDLKLIADLCRTAESSKDHSPEGIAFRLIAESYSKDDPSKMESDADQISRNRELKNIYTQYLTKRDSIPQMLLSTEEEILLLEKMLSFSLDQKSDFNDFGKLAIMTNRLHHLKNEIPTGSSSDLSVTLVAPEILEKPKKNRDFDRDPSIFFSVANKFIELKHSVPAKDPVMITKPGQRLYEVFFDYYELAKQRDHTITWLIPFLDNDPMAPDYLVELLRQVSVNPELFPSGEELMGIFQNKKRDEFIEKVASRLSQSKDTRNVIQEREFSLVPERGIKIASSSTKSLQLEKRDPMELPIGTLEAVKIPPPLLTRSQLKVSFQKIPSGGVQLSGEALHELVESIALRDNELSLTPESKKLGSEIIAYWSSDDRKKKWHLIPPEKIENLHTCLLIQKSENEKRLYVEECELLSLANRLPEDLKNALLLQTEKLGGLRMDVTLQDLYVVTARSKHFSLASKNPEIQLLEREIIQKTLELLSKRAHLQQIDRSQEILKNLKSQEPLSDSYRQLSESLFKEITRRPPYKAHENPEFLIFEVLTGLGLFDWQVSDLKKLYGEGKEPLNLIMQKVMGSGKTKVYLSLLALQKADGKRIPFVVVPESQFETVAQAMEIQSNGLFHQQAKSLQFEERNISTQEGLNDIIMTLEDALADKHFFVLTDKTLHKFNVSYKQAWYEYLKSNPVNSRMIERIKAFEKIRSLLNGHAIFDEADILNNCRHEYIFAIGKNIPLKPSHCELVADLYDSIEEVISRYHPFTQIGYMDEIKLACINAFVDKIVRTKFVEASPDEIKDYLNGGKTGATYVETLDHELRNLLAIALKEFESLLPMTLEKRCGESFGYSDNPDKLLSVPYLASGIPSKTSDFNFPYTLLNYTIQTLQSEGINESLLNKLIMHMQERATKERRQDPTLTLEETQGFKDFQDLCEGSVVIPFFGIKPNDIALLKNYYSTNHEALRRFARKHLFPEVKQYSEQLTSTPYSLNSLFDEIVGFTGTPWNEITFPNKIKTISDPSSSGKTLGIIRQNSHVIHNISAATSPQEIAGSIIQLQAADGHGYNAFIDAGALFLGIDNQTVALEFLKNLPETIKGVVFFKDNLPFVAERSPPALVPYNKTSLKNKDLYIYYDQWHTTGTDLKIAGKSFLSIGKKTTRRDLEQAYMRDRQAESGPRVKILVPEDVKDYILKDQNVVDLNPEILLRHTQINQERELNEQLMMSVMGKMQECLEAMLRVLLNTENIEPELLRPYSEIIANILVVKKEDSPYEAWGRWKGQHSSKKVFSEIINRFLNKAKPLCNAFPELLNLSVLEANLNDCVDLTLFPKKIEFPADTDQNQQAEVHTQQQTQQESTAFVSRDQENTLSKSPSQKWGLTMWNWEENPSSGPSQKSYYPLVDVAAVKMNREDLPSYAHSSAYLMFLSQSKNNPPIMSLSDIFTDIPLLQKFSGIFDLESTYNFLPVTSKDCKDNFSVDRAIPFDWAQKKAKQILILKELETDISRVILISQAESGHFFAKLAQERMKDDPKELDVTLYDMNLGVIQSNNSSILEGKQFIDDQIAQKIVQVKFFRGDLIYNKKEMEILKDWIGKNQPSVMKSLFVDEILFFREQKKKDFPASLPAILFNELEEAEIYSRAGPSSSSSY